MKFGFTSTSFRNIKDVKKIVDIAVSAGADCIEWGSDVHVKDIETAKYVRKICDDAGIETSSYGTFYRIGSNDTEEWKKICEIASVLGASSIRVWLGKKGSAKTDEENLGFTYAELDKYIRTGEIEDKAKKEIIDRKHKANLFKLQFMPCFKPEI